MCNAAITIDQGSAKTALKEIAQAKVLVPKTLLQTLDWAIQAYGAAGVCQDTPLAYMWAHGRTMRIVDGPDEVHLMQLGESFFCLIISLFLLFICCFVCQWLTFDVFSILGRNENKRGKGERERIERHKQTTEALFKKYGVESRDVLEMNRVRSEMPTKAKI